MLKTCRSSSIALQLVVALSECAKAGEHWNRESEQSALGQTALAPAACSWTDQSDRIRPRIPPAPLKSMGFPRVRAAPRAHGRASLISGGLGEFCQVRTYQNGDVCTLHEEGAGVLDWNGLAAQVLANLGRPSGDSDIGSAASGDCTATKKHA